jgi:hypothetical protein
MSNKERPDFRPDPREVIEIVGGTDMDERVDREKSLELYEDMMDLWGRVGQRSRTDMACVVTMAVATYLAAHKEEIREKALAALVEGVEHILPFVIEKFAEARDG